MLKGFNYRETNESAEELANRVINQLKNEGNLEFPIDPFYLLSRFGIRYKLLNFENLEGIYIVPNDTVDIALVGINKNRSLTRQRFTAAHEICHHIKDRNLEIIHCPIDGRKNDIEKFADLFASELLMPTSYLKKKANMFAINGFVSFDDALRISIYFGTSFQACIYALAYILRMIEGNIESRELSKRILKFKPTIRMNELQISHDELALKYQLINHYSFVNTVSEELKWFRFKNHYIANEERLE